MARKVPKLAIDNVALDSIGSSLTPAPRQGKEFAIFRCSDNTIVQSCSGKSRFPTRAAALMILDRALRSISQSMYALPSKYSLSLWQTPQRMCRFSGVSSPPAARARMWARSLPLMPHAKHVPRSMNSAFESYPLASHSLSAQCARMASSVGIFLGVVFNAFSVRLSAT